MTDKNPNTDSARTAEGSFVLVVGGSPEPSSPELVARLARGASLVIACDRGADALMAAGVVPDEFYGDADSVSAEAVSWLGNAGVDVSLFAAEKDDTDLGLCLDAAREAMAAGRPEGAVTPTRVVVTCVSGGRCDHQLGVFGSLARHADLAPAIVEDDMECRLLSPDGAPRWELGPSDAGKTFSAVPVSAGCVVSERGMQWCLDHEPMEPLSDRGISNVVASGSASVECHEGILAAFLLG